MLDSFAWDNDLIVRGNQAVTFAQGVWAQALAFNHSKDIQEVD